MSTAGLCIRHLDGACIRKHFPPPPLLLLPPSHLLHSSRKWRWPEETMCSTRVQDILFSVCPGLPRIISWSQTCRWQCHANCNLQAAEITHAKSAILPSPLLTQFLNILPWLGHLWKYKFNHRDQGSETTFFAITPLPAQENHSVGKAKQYSDPLYTKSASCWRNTPQNFNRNILQVKESRGVEGRKQLKITFIKISSSYPCCCQLSWRNTFGTVKTRN